MAVSVDAGFIIPGDSVVLSGITTTGTFNNQNVGTNKTVTPSVNSFLLTGPDGGNYVAVHTLFGDPPPPLTANITPAVLTYLADPAVRLQTEVPITDLTGRPIGFQGNDTQGNSTVGTLVWTTSAGSASPAGVYPIFGSGLAAANYTFQQDPGNATALALLDEINPTDPRRKCTDINVTSTNRARDGALPAYDPYVHCRVNDRASVPEPDFGPLYLARMSRSEMQQLVESRKKFKERLFADAICKLESVPCLGRRASVPNSG